MIKKQQKWIALAVVVTFMWLLQVSAMPLAAENSAEQGPGYVEAAGRQIAPPAKKSILPVILIGVGVVAVAAVLFLVVFKTTYDITGNWTFIFTGPTNETYVLTFSGSKESGTFVFAAVPMFNGTYAVDGKNVTMTVTLVPTIEFKGQFTNKDTMKRTRLQMVGVWDLDGYQKHCQLYGQPGARRPLPTVLGQRENQFAADRGRDDRACDGREPSRGSGRVVKPNSGLDPAPRCQHAVLVKTGVAALDVGIIPDIAIIGIHHDLRRLAEDPPDLVLVHALLEQAPGGLVLPAVRMAGKRLLPIVLEFKDDPLKEDDPLFELRYLLLELIDLPIQVLGKNRTT